MRRAPSRRPSLVVLGAFISLVFLAPSASAAVTHEFIGSFGLDGMGSSRFPDFEGGSTEGGLLLPYDGGNGQLAFDQTAGRLLAIVAKGEDGVCQFGAFEEGEKPPVVTDGEAPPLNFPAPGEPCVKGFVFGNIPGSHIASIGVDRTGGPATGNIYIASAREELLHGISASGSKLPNPPFPVERDLKWFNSASSPPGAAVDSTGGVWVIDRLGQKLTRLVLNEDGEIEPTKTVSTSAQGLGINPHGIAIDSRDNLYVNFTRFGNTSPGPGRISKYTSPDYTSATLIDEGPATAMAVNEVNDHLFIAYQADVREYDVSGSSSSCEFSEGKSKCEVLRFASEGEISAAKGPVSPLLFRGIAVEEGENPAEAKIYVSDSGNAQIHVFNTETDEPIATTSLATDITATTVTAHGTVNPNGFALADCHFELVTELQFQANGFANANETLCEPAAASIPADESSHPVSAQLSDLEPGTRYRYRLIATSSEGTGTGQSQSFATLGPLISDTEATDVTYSETILRASVNPQGQSTTFRFEYVSEADCQAAIQAEGPGHCFDEATATLESGSIGADHAEHAVSTAIEGLQEGAAHRLRVIATNADAPGGVAGPDARFTTFMRPEPADPDCPNAADRDGPSARLPDCRAYEQVSPLQKGSSDVSHMRAQASASGDALAFPAQIFRTLPGGAGNSGFNPYLAQRDGVGVWATKSLTTGLSPGVLAYRYLGFSEDLSRMAFCSHLSIGVPGDGDGLYLRDNLADTYFEVPGTSGAANDGTCQDGISNGEGLAASLDYRHVVFQDPEQLTPDAPAGAASIVYEWRDASLLAPGEEPLRVVSRLPDGSAVGGDLRGNGYRFHAVSQSGERILWRGGEGNAATLYQRIGGTGTVEVGASERSTPDPDGPRAKTFVDASNDGEVVFFASAEKLTDNSTATPAAVPFGPLSGELYRYDFDAPEGERLTDITPVPGDPQGARVLGALGASADGERIYFVALAALEGGAVAGKPNLYLWDRNGGAPTIAHVATLAESGVDQDNVKVNFANKPFWPRRVDVGGEHAVFLSTAPLGSYDNAGRAMAYRYDAIADRLLCVSCDPSGEAASGDAALGRPLLHGFANHRVRVLSADGARVFFETADSLLPPDVNGKIDVYQWEAVGKGSCESDAENGGCLTLISTGQHSSDSRFVDASESGNDVFFTTRERLSPRDEDSLVDIYDARVNGIAADPFPPEPDCLGETCQPAAIVPGHPTPASSGFRGQGNPLATHRPRKRCPRGKRKVRRAGKLRCVKRAKRHLGRRANRERGGHR